MGKAGNLEGALVTGIKSAPAPITQTLWALLQGVAFAVSTVTGCDLQSGLRMLCRFPHDFGKILGAASVECHLRMKRRRVPRPKKSGYAKPTAWNAALLSSNLARQKRRHVKVAFAPLSLCRRVRSGRFADFSVIRWFRQMSGLR